MDFHRNKEDERLKNNIWDAFVNFIDVIYFPGASEELDRKLIAYEYDIFKQCYYS